jgi:hypothetical protein
MFLCGKEKEFLADHTHRTLVKVVGQRIDELARHMGFSERQIERREFRAEKADGRIIQIAKE